MNLTNNLNHQKQKLSNNSLKENLYNKKVTCPVCDNVFDAKVNKAKKAIIAGKDSDFFIRYKVINPYFYEIWLCPYCGYAAMKSEFLLIKDVQKEKIKSQISSKWTPRKYPDLYDENTAIDRFKLALLTAIVIGSKESTKAMLSLKIAWMYRLLEKKEEEMDYLKRAIEGLNSTYYNESLPIYGLDQFNILYLIGELKRRTGENQEALRYFGELLVERNASQKIKEMARDMKDIIKSQN
ncbi:DUF2225 domain-containing protein [Clostridium massiliamazoniense]|uniref:DUF2225 domain-containing protein n=1 Tax=Clostridium massiliamazoniense TaxID=1347366 RepID=UPI0006D7E57E|nr:DUF2225 domain-containing protein [Clostridium massiliamazoniense]